LDIAVLRPDATLREVTEAAREVEATGAASVCVASCNVAMAKSVTSRVCSVIGFPHGNVSPDVKFTEARAAVEDGAVELDVVINYGRFLDGRLTAVKEELRRILQYTMPRRVRVKAILECCFYSSLEITSACKLCMDLGVDWVKSSTGCFGGATPEAALTMLAAVNGGCQVKASGGIKSYADACLYLNAGCTRLGIGYRSYKGLLP
jgi:deoxyribose-phosphate aldolase